jgi:pimeloyl-ACP methyl ester carboxylesterase
LLSYDYTKGLIDLLTSQPSGYTEGKDLFTFPYDWRFGVSDDAVNQLKGQIDYITSTTGSSVVDVIAHSTGGLIVKKYVMEHPTDHHIGKAVFVGVPNLGAPKALKVLLEGDNFGIPGLSDSEMQKIAKNMPVAYDLAPGQEYYNSLGSDLRIGVFNAFTPSYQDLTYSQTADYLKSHGFNSPA